MGFKPKGVTKWGSGGSTFFNNLIADTTQVGTFGGNLGSDGNKFVEVVNAHAIAGSVGAVYQRYRQRGYSDQEARKGAYWLGLNYGEVTTAKNLRNDKEQQSIADAAFRAEQNRERDKAAAQIAARIRRYRRAETASDRGGTIRTGALGIPGGGATNFTQLLGQ